MAKVWRCSYESVRLGVLFVNVFHVIDDPDTGIGDASADDVRDGLNTALTTKYKAILDVGTQLNTLVVRQELAPGDTSIPEESALTIGVAGTRAAADTNLPPSMTLLASLRTNAAVRSGHGRLFLPPPIGQAALTGNGTWRTTDTYWTACKAFMDELIASHHIGGVGVGQTLRPVVYSRTRRARGDADYWFGVTAHIMRPLPHWLRSRATAP